MMSLEYPSADHRQAVQPNLRREHHDECSQNVRTAGTVRLGKDRGEQARADTASPAGSAQARSR